MIYSLIIPARNEASGLRLLLPELSRYLPAGTEVIVVNDGSEDETRGVCESHGVKVVSHPYPKGNGAAVKSGARAATGEVLIFMDADGQHRPIEIPLLLEKFGEGYDMVVGARSRASQAGAHRAVANDVFSKLATWMVNHTVADLTSGFRVVDAAKFRKFLYLLPNGFSYPTSITMSFFRSGFSVGYVPIVAPKRVGRGSHINLFRDGVRFLLIIFKIGSLYSPLKLFFPLSVAFFLAGIGNYLYTFLTVHRFTNMSALLIITSILVFLFGLVSEQIANLLYKDDR